MDSYGSPDIQSPPDSGPDSEAPYSKKPTLSKGEAKVVKDRFRSACKYYDCSFKDNAQRCRDLYCGYHWPRRKAAAHCPVINYSKYIVDTQVGSIAHRGGDVILKPESPLGQANEDRSRRAANYGYRKANARRETKRALKDCRVYGFGVVMSYWHWEGKTTPSIEGRPGGTPDPEAVLAAIESGSPPPQPDPADLPPVIDYACCKRIDPRAFRISPEADWVIEDAAWCGYVEVRPLDEVKADPRFKKGVTQRLKGSSKGLKALLAEDYQSKPEEELPSDVKRVECWHYFEKRRQIHVVFAEEEPAPLLVEPWYWEHGMYPFDLLFDPSLEDDFYMAVPPLMQWEHMQREINESRGQLATHRRRFNRKYLALQNRLSSTAKEKLKSGEDGTIIEVDAQSTQGILEPIQDAQMQPEVYRSSDIATGDMLTISGTNQYQANQIPTKRVTTTETEAILSSGGALKQEMAQRYEEFCASVASKIFKLMQQYSDFTMQLPIYDEQDQIAGWDQVSKEQIQGDYDFEMAVGSTEIPNQQDRIQEIGFLFQSLTPFIQMGIIDPKPLIEQLLKQMPNIKDVGAIVNPPPPPGMQPPGGDAGLGGVGAPLPGPQPVGAPAGGAQLPPELLAALGGAGG